MRCCIVRAAWRVRVKIEASSRQEISRLSQRERKDNTHNAHSIPSRRCSNYWVMHSRREGTMEGIDAFYSFQSDYVPAKSLFESPRMYPLWLLFDFSCCGWGCRDCLLSAAETKKMERIILLLLLLRRWCARQEQHRDALAACHAHSQYLYVDGCIKGPEIFTLFHHEFSVRLPQRAGNLFWGNYAVERWLFEICVSHHVTAPPWIRFAGDGIWGRGKLHSTCGLLSSLLELISSHTIRHDSRLRASNCKKARRNESVLHFYNGRREKEAVCVYEQEGRLDDTTRELMLQGFR